MYLYTYITRSTYFAPEATPPHVNLVLSDCFRAEEWHQVLRMGERQGSQEVS